MLPESTANIIKMTGKQYVKKKHCLVWKRKTDTKKNTGVTLVNEIATQTSVCTDCTSRKSNFFKTNKTNKKQKIVFANLKNKC